MITLTRLAAVLLLAAGAVPALAEVQFAIGEPAEGSIKSGIGQVSGWAVSDREIVSVEAFIDGASLGLVPYGGSRLDVANAFPQYPDAEHSGWSMKWNYALHEPGEHVLTIVITEDDGSQTTQERLFSTTRFHAEFISDPAAVRTEDALVSSPARGRLRIEGAEVQGEIVDVELAWDRTAQQFQIDKITYAGQQLENQSPLAQAGPDLTVETGATVAVQGSGTDPDGLIAEQAWSQVSGPGVTLIGADQWLVEFTAPAQPGDIRLRLTVHDDQGESDSDDVVIKVVSPTPEPPPNQAPTANAGANRSVQPGESVTVSGSGSDADGSIVGWSWTQISGTAVSLSGAATQQVQFTAPATAGGIRLRLTVTDDDGATDTDDVIITVLAPPSNQAPTANAGADRSVQQGESVTVSGSGSDADGAIVGWSWAQISGTAVSLSGAATQQVQFTAPATAGDIRLRLTVTDDDGATDTDDVTITVEESSDPGNTTGSTLQSMLDDINEVRSQPRVCNGTTYPSAPPLQWSSSLADIAMQHSMDMAQNGYFSHTSLDGTSMGSRVFPYWNGTTVGENIAASSVDRSDGYVVNLWLGSTSGHCELLMNPAFTHVGVGKGHDPDNGYTYKYFWTMDVGG